MHAPITLLVISTALGVAVPLAFGMLTHSIQDPTTLVVARIVSLAIVPLLVARIAYRQGYDAAANSRPPSNPA